MRSTLIVGACLIILALAGCPNPNAIGVQKFGTISAYVVMASSGQPVAHAEVIVNSTQNCITPANGACSVPNVPIGPQVVYAIAPGLSSPQQPVPVTENCVCQVTLQMSPTTH